MKFLIHGNAPSVKTGYGVQIAQLIKCLADDGHEPAVSSTYGIQGGIENWNGFRIYGCGYDVNSNDRIHMHADHWFGKDRDKGWIITCVDVWAMVNPLLDEYNVAAWVPIDHFTAVGPQPGVREFFDRTKAVPVAMSRFGESLLLRAGYDPVYIPLSVDTAVYKPTADLNGTSTRSLHDIPEDAFVVGMVAMNKGWAKDRKGFNEAFWGFSLFERDHPDAYLLVHADNKGGAEGQDLRELAIHSGIPPHKIKWTGGPSQYGYYIGYTPEMMAALYTSFDVLLAPSHGEGFCVPLIEAQACGTPVIATNFSAQTELVPDGCGWLVEGQPEWDPAHHALYKVPLISDVVDQLENAYNADRSAMAQTCIDHATHYDTHTVYEKHWKPFIAELSSDDRLPLEREPMPDENAVAVICPIHQRRDNIEQLQWSFDATNDGSARLVLVENADGTCAEGWNRGLAETTEPWVLLIGDDVRFHEGWLDAARKLSADYDVIGTNDTANGVKNPRVASGAHADHFFVRRKYVEEYGACLDGPGALAPEAYRHWYVDMEMVKLAKARGVFAPCLDSIVEHLHPGYDGDEEARRNDPTYMTAVEHADADEKTFLERLPLIEQQRRSRAHL